MCSGSVICHDYVSHTIGGVSPRLVDRGLCQSHHRGSLPETRGSSGILRDPRGALGAHSKMVPIIQDRKNPETVFQHVGKLKSLGRLFAGRSRGGRKALHSWDCLGSQSWTHQDSHFSQIVGGLTPNPRWCDWGIKVPIYA